MSQHFLLSAAARTLSLATVARMSDQEARTAFASIRWADNDGQPYCGKCGCADVYSYAARPIFKCKGCGAQFSVTSGTIFADRKLPVRDILLAIAIFCNGAKGHSALQLSRDLDCQYKSAFVLAHKLREAMASEAAGMTIGGEGKIAHIDGAYFGKHVRKENKKTDRKDARMIEDQRGKKQVVVVMREVGGRTLSFVVGKESDGVAIARQRVESGTVMHADESKAWERLHASYETRRVDRGNVHLVGFRDRARIGMAAGIAVPGAELQALAVEQVIDPRFAFAAVRAGNVGFRGEGGFHAFSAALRIALTRASMLTSPSITPASASV